MHKKIKSFFLCLPFICGSLCFSFDIFNLVSSLLFFVGGYVALKHFFNYKKICRGMHSTSSIEQENDIQDMLDSTGSKQQRKDKKYSYQAENREVTTENHGKLEGNRVREVEKIFLLEDERNDVKVRRRMKR